MTYGQQPRDRITAALMEVANPSPRPQLPPMPGQGMNMPAIATPGTVAGMGAQSSASPSFAGAAPPPPLSAAAPPPMPGGAPPPPVMPPAPGQPPSPGAGAPLMRY